MRFWFVLAAPLCACSVAPPPGASPAQVTQLAGRTAGAPQHCVLMQPGESLRSAEGDGHTLIYGSGRTIWVNHLGSQCGFHWNDTLLTEPFGSHYCRGDIIRSFDPTSHIPGPSCILGDFVPYSR